MTEQPAESAAGTPESVGLPTPTFSGGLEAAPTSSGAFGLNDAFVEQLIAHPKVNDFISRKFQSGKDRAISNLQKQVDELKAGTGTPAQVRQAVAELEGENSAAVAPGRANAAVPSAEEIARVQQRVNELLNDASVSVNDPEFMALAGKNYLTTDDWYHTVSRFTAKRAKQAAQPGPEQNGGGSGGRPPLSSGSTDIDKLIARQSELSRKSHLSVAEKAELVDVKNKIRAKAGA